MKHFLLTCIAATAVMASQAAEPAATLQAVKGADHVKQVVVKNSASKTGVKKLAKGVTLTTDKGIKKLNFAADRAGKPAKIKPQAKKHAVRKLPEGYKLFESFEAWDGENYEWLPEGWTAQRQAELGQSWTPSNYGVEAIMYGLPAPADGEFYFGISFGYDEQDEWLITPYVDVEDGNVLSYYLYLDPMFLYGMDNIDWDTYEYIGDKEVAATLQIMGQEEGGEWKLLHDYANDYIDYCFEDLSYMTPAEMLYKTENLSDYTGKKARFAFRYVGIDGNTMFIDAVGVGYPMLDGISYLEPIETLYWGADGTEEIGMMGAGFAQYPVFTPITWMNYSDAEATFSWDYCDPITADWTTSDDQYELSVEYVPDYSSEASKRNNLFYPPILNASAPGAVPGSYQADYAYFQAGGKFEFKFNDGSSIDNGDLFIFDAQKYGMATTILDDEDIQDSNISIFGQSMHTDQYWLNYSLNGEDANASDYAHLIGIANYLFPSAAPLVVNGINVYGKGKFGPDVELKAEIYRLGEDFVFDAENPDVVATATCKGSDVRTYDPNDTDYLCIHFDLPEPVVLQLDDETGAYFVCFTGFRNDDVEFFAPLHSYYPNENYYTFGYLYKEINLESQTGRPAYKSMSPMSYTANGGYVDVYGSFAIGLDAEYPWLTTESEGIELEGTPAEVALGSYYDGSKLTVETPEGITASAAGRYDECKLTVAHTGSAAVEGSIKVKAPGVELTIPVKATSGITDVAAGENAEVIGLYDLSGRRVDAAAAAPGVYVVKYSDGTARKQLVK